MFEQLKQLDRDIFLTLNGFHADWLDPVMWWISSVALWIPLFIFVMYYAYKKQGWRFMIILLTGLALCILLADRISVELFKEVFQRYRPTHNTEIGHLVHTVIKPNGEEYRGGLFSFVSSHATNFMAIGFFIFLHLKKYSRYWYFLFLWVGIVAYSRIYLGVHYPADLICGAALGAAIGGLVYKLSIWLPKKVLNLNYE